MSGIRFTPWSPRTHCPAVRTTPLRVPLQRPAFASESTPGTRVRQKEPSLCSTSMEPARPRRTLLTFRSYLETSRTLDYFSGNKLDFFLMNKQPHEGAGALRSLPSAAPFGKGVQCPCLRALSLRGLLFGKDCPGLNEPRSKVKHSSEL